MDRRGDKQTGGSDAFERGDTAIELPLGKQDHLVEKKDGAKRFVVDYRSLNDCTKQDSYPISYPEAPVCIGAYQSVQKISKKPHFYSKRAIRILCNAFWFMHGLLNYLDSPLYFDSIPS